MKSNPKTVAVIQARIGSTRLPNKVMRLILGVPMLQHQLERVKLARGIDQIVVATTTELRAIEIIELAKNLHVDHFVGSETDVLDRVYQSSKQVGADIVVRLTADCPVIDSQELTKFIDYFCTHKEKIDYLGTGPTYPEGLDMEILSFETLERAWREAEKIIDREHVTAYVYMSGKFRVTRHEYIEDLSKMRWTVDEEKDFNFITAIYENLFPRFGYQFGVKDIRQLLSEKPELMKINEGIIRNEGFLKSLEK